MPNVPHLPCGAAVCTGPMWFALFGYLFRLEALGTLQFGGWADRYRYCFELCWQPVWAPTYGRDVRGAADPCRDDRFPKD